MNIILIGGSGKIGSSLVLNLIENGYNIAIGDLDTLDINKKIETITNISDTKVFIENVDITSESQYLKWINNANDYLGKIDGAINCSYPKGKKYGLNLDQVNLDSFNENVSMHLGSYFNFLNITSSFMEKKSYKGSILCTSSIYGHIAPRFDIYDETSMTMPVEYAAIKSSINHLIKYFAKYYSGSGLRFNSVSPGGIIDGQPDNFVKAYSKHSLSKGLLDVEDIVPVMEFMISKKSSYINGQTIVVDDGFSL